MRSEPRRAETALEDLADLFRVLMRDNRAARAARRRSRAVPAVPGARATAAGRSAAGRLERRRACRGDALVPPLVLQPLLENAVYHGIEPLTEQGLLSIKSSCRAARVHAILRNPYVATGARHQRRQQHGARQHPRAPRAAFRRRGEACEHAGRGRRVHIASACRIRYAHEHSKPHEAPLRVLIVDDEAPARARLRELLDDCARRARRRGRRRSRDGARRSTLLPAAAPTIVLIDIHMPRHGRHRARAAPRRLLGSRRPWSSPPRIDQHAVQAFEVNAVDYLVKPVARRAPARRAAEGAAAGAPGTRALARAAPRAAALPVACAERGTRSCWCRSSDVLYLQGRAEVRHRAHRASASTCIEESLTQLEEEFGDALRARASQLPGRARDDPRLRAHRRTKT